MLEHPSRLASCVLITVLAVAAWGSPGGAATPDSGPPLFVDAGFEKLAVVSEPGVVRRRAVRVDLSALDAAADAASRSRGRSAATLTLDLFPDVAPVAALDQLRSESRTTLSFVGHLVGRKGDGVTLTWGDGVLTGHVRRGEQVFRIRYAGNGFHAIEELDPAAFPPEAEPLTTSWSALAFESPIGRRSDLPDDGDLIDALVIYTGAARVAAGGGAAIESEIAGAIADANAAFANSGVVQRIRLVHTAELDYAESGNPSTELTRLRGTSDGYLDGVHELRDLYGADLVALVVSNMSGACGIGYVMTVNSTSFAPNAFSVTDRDCFFQYTLAHEMGHNMGCQHDPPNAGTNPVFPYSYGYRDASHGFRTVMAYPCSGTSCPRVRHWSDDAITYLGAATGNAGQDNARSLNEVRVTVANFRSSVPIQD